VRVLGGKGGLYQALAAGYHRVRVLGGVGRERRSLSSTCSWIP
jgi:hypothetical protein